MKSNTDKEALFAKLWIYVIIYNHCEDHGECKELEQILGTHHQWALNYYSDLHQSPFVKNCLDRYIETKYRTPEESKGKWK